MKTFDKRTVPGLEDFSSDSDEDNEIVNKRLRVEDDVEIEIEVKNNEFLKEDPISSTNEFKIETYYTGKVENKRHNSIWGNVVQDELLGEGLKNCGVEKINVKRSVESYTVKEFKKNKNKRHFDNKHLHRNTSLNGHMNKERNRKLPVKERVLNTTYDKVKNRDHIKIDPTKHIENVFEIARILSEPKVDLINQCYNVLGLSRCLEILYLTEDIEERGGLLVLDGSRRRSPGGVFLQLIKESTDINPEEKRLIFVCNTPNRNNYPRKRTNNNNNNTSNNNHNKASALIEVELVKTEKVIEHQSEVSNKEIKDEELEDGEIP